MVSKSEARRRNTVPTAWKRDLDADGKKLLEWLRAKRPDATELEMSPKLLSRKGRSRGAAVRAGRMRSLTLSGAHRPVPSIQIDARSA